MTGIRAAILLCIAACLPVFGQEQKKLFSLVLPDSSGIKFNNVVLDDKEVNIIEYLYFYNGAGVAIGDVNNDGLPDIFFSSNRYSCKLYLNKGNLKFEDVSQKAGVLGEPGTFKTGVVMVDINNDGWMDIYICCSASLEPDKRRNLLYVNNKNGTFTNRAKEYGIDDDGYGTQAYFNDTDGDGDLDLLVVNHPYNFVETDGIHLTYNKSKELVASKDTSHRGESDRFYENVGGKFIDITYKAGLRTRSFGLSALMQDFNGDGKVDIYQANDFLEPDYLFINKGNNKFVNEFDTYFKHGSYFSMGTDYADINNDGHSDLIVTDMLPTDNKRRKQLQRPSNYDQFDKQVKYGFGYQYLKNVVQLNNGNGSYSDVGYYSGMAFSDWSWAVLIQDFDNDQLKDVYIANGMPRDIHDLDYVRFKTDSIRKALIKKKTPGDVLKLLSVIPTVRVQKHFYKNYGRLNFRRESAESGLDQFGWSFGAAYGDLDGDGDLEIVVNNSNDYAYVYKNNSIERGGGNSIRIRLVGPEKNVNGIGTKIETVTADKVKSTLVANPFKGYLSSHDNTLIIGIGKNSEVDVTVTWPDGKTELLKSLTSEKTHLLTYSSANLPMEKNESQNKVPKPFIDITDSSGLKVVHTENAYIDFKLEPLLPHRFSQLGPCLTVADFNGDKLDDVFVGGAKGKSGRIFFQVLGKDFSEISQSVFEKDKEFEDGASLALDIDKDGDMDLLVSSGGNEFPNQNQRYPLRMYLNNGAGVFSNSKSKPKFFSSANTLEAADVDKDGFPEIFLGGRVAPGHYGRIPRSYYLKIVADSLVDVTEPVMAKIGMVTSAKWVDMNQDGWVDLVLAGEWMPITIFYNKNGILNKEPFTIKDSEGWWNTLNFADLDGDGDQDLIGGNLGLNTRYRGSSQRPVTMLVNDFDQNGSTDCMISVFNRDKSYPMALRDNVLDQMPYLRKKFLRYSSYSNATVEDIFSPEQIANSDKFKSSTMVSSMFRNDGDGKFSMLDLPPEAQLFPVNAIQIEDINKDSLPDLVLAGNDYSTEVETGRNDAGIGLVLIQKEKFQFQALPVTESGFFVPGDVKRMESITIANRKCFLVGKNKGEIQVVQMGL